MDIKEGRRFPRLNERIFILCRSKEKPSMNIIKRFTKNISAGGLMFESDGPLPRQDIFILDIYQPSIQSGQEFISITALAKVKWVTPIDFTKEYEGIDKFKVGMEFLKLDDRDRSTIAKYAQTKLNN